jgi:hypothetical protein
MRFRKKGILLRNLFDHQVGCAGHDQLLEICLLEKSAKHNFIITQQRSSNNYLACQLVDSRP